MEYDVSNVVAATKFDISMHLDEQPEHCGCHARYGTGQDEGSSDKRQGQPAEPDP